MRFAMISVFLVMALALAGCATVQENNQQAQATSAAWATELAPTSIGSAAYPSPAQGQATAEPYPGQGEGSPYPAQDMSAYPAPGSSEGGTAAAPEMRPTPVMFPGAVMVFNRVGGIGGSNDTWTFYEDGRVIDKHGEVTHSNPAVVSAFLASARLAGFYDMQTQYGQNQCCDRFAYTLTIRDGDQQHTVTWFDGVEAPAALIELGAQITSVLEAP